MSQLFAAVIRKNAYDALALPELMAFSRLANKWVLRTGDAFVSTSLT